jgi:predicted metal-dependent enzyme (double-stranded beta helix superfamily)
LSEVFVHYLVQQLRKVVGAGEVDESTIKSIELLVGSAFPRLGEELLFKPNPRPGRYLCYQDPDFDFVIMALVWGPGDATPIHDHGTWGVELVLQNQLKVTTYTDCEVNPEPVDSAIIGPGSVMHNLPPARDVHKIEHAGGDCAISLHIYGRSMNSNRSFIPGRGFEPRQLPVNAWPRPIRS